MGETVKTAIGNGRQDYELAARTILEAMAADRTLTQKTVAMRIVMSTTWVCCLLQWYRAGCPSDTVFGPAAATRRAAKKIPSTESGGTPSENGVVYVRGRLMRDGPYWQPWLSVGNEIIIDGSPNIAAVNQPPAGEGQATVRILGVVGAASGLIKVLIHPELLSREMLGMTYASLGLAKKRATLGRLAEQLTKVVALATDALAETRAALKDTPRVLDDDFEDMVHRRSL
jgi:hypothetical protein